MAGDTFRHPVAHHGAALGLALVVAGSAASARETGIASPQQAGWGAASHLGFSLARAEYRLPCRLTQLHCQGDLAGTLPSQYWSVELGWLDLGRSSSQPWSVARAQGVSLSLLGRLPVPVLGSNQLSVYGRVGTTYGFMEPRGTAAAWRQDSGLGMSYGAGLSWDFTPRLSATLGWDSHDFRIGSGLRDVRATSVGLQWRY